MFTDVLMHCVTSYGMQVKKAKKFKLKGLSIQTKNELKKMMAIKKKWWKRLKSVTFVNRADILIKYRSITKKIQLKLQVETRLRENGVINSHDIKVFYKKNNFLHSFFYK